MSVIENQPLVSIGLPVYNRPELLRLSLESLINQTYENMEIIISDDCSPGQGTKQVLDEFIQKDKRIAVFYQNKNLGGALNHKFVQEKATGEFFFWANEDDEWESNYIETGVKALLENSDCNAWCCTIDNIDSFGRVIRNYEGFSRWTSTSNKTRDIVKYLFEPEIMGKSHMFHSIFRTTALRKVIPLYFMTEAWSTDVCFALAFLARNNIIASDEVLFHKRVSRETDCKDKVEMLVVKRPGCDTFPFNRSFGFIRESYKAVKDTKYKGIVLVVMVLRLPKSFKNKCVGRAKSMIRGIKSYGRSLRELIGGRYAKDSR